jgi:hypothetical protein
MKLVMTILNKDGTIHKSEAIEVAGPAKLNKVHALGLYGHNMYLLRKKKRVEVDLKDGKIIYALLET